MRVYNKYLKGKNYVALSVYPKGKENISCNMLLKLRHLMLLHLMCQFVL